MLFRSELLGREVGREGLQWPDLRTHYFIHPVELLLELMISLKLPRHALCIVDNAHHYQSRRSCVRLGDRLWSFFRAGRGLGLISPREQPT